MRLSRKIVTGTLHSSPANTQVTTALLLRSIREFSSSVKVKGYPTAIFTRKD
jgi:hypothetical protein